MSGISRGADVGRGSDSPLTEGIAWHSLSSEDAVATLGVDPGGLTSAEAAERLARYGPNQLPEDPPPSALVVFLHQFQSPLIYILLIAGAFTLAIGKHVDTVVIAAVLALNATIGFIQERQAERSVRALMHLVSAKAHVIRDGVEQEIEGADVVPGDLVLLESGRRVPADLRLVSTTTLAVDESLLTGESLPAGKGTDPVAPEAGLGDRTSIAFTGTVVTTGRGRGHVVATGIHTQLGRIAELVRGEGVRVTPLQQRMTRFAHLIGAIVMVASLGTVLLGLLFGGTLEDMVLVGVTLAVAAVPEGLPVVFTITLALGVRRMAQRRAIIRRLPAVETLGSTTVIGSDKTGTLTENRMTVQEVWAGGVLHQAAGDAPGIDGSLRMALVAGVMTNEATLHSTGDDAASQGDPTEIALLIAARRWDIDPRALRAGSAIHRDIPFEPQRQYSATTRAFEGAAWTFVKGAPERVLDMCDRLMGPDGVTALDRQAVEQAAADMATRGLRVLAMAFREEDGDQHLSDAPDGETAHPDRLVFAGLQGMQDPPREGVREAIEGCRKAGIRVVMITGDHVATARSIARELGIVADPDAPAISGAEMTTMSEEELQRRASDVAVYARVSPDQKLRIVKALQATGNVVAVTGDGVNDAPALKAADIGVAMGRSGTDVAREASDMVLTDDAFVSIYAAVEEGRVTFENVRKVTFFLVSTGVAAIILIPTAIVLGWPLPLLPAQMLWMNLVTNGLQDVALAFEPGEPDVLKKPPRRREEDVMTGLLWERTIIAGLVMAVGTFALFVWELERSDSLPLAQTVALTTMVVFQMFQVGEARSETRSLFRMSPFSNRLLILAVAGALLIHVGALYLPLTQTILRVEPIEIDAWVRIILVASTLLIAMETHKAVRRRWPRGVARGAH